MHIFGLHQRGAGKENWGERGIKLTQRAVAMGSGRKQESDEVHITAVRKSVRASRLLKVARMRAEVESG